MSDDLVKRLWLHDCEGITREAADRIEELEDKLDWVLVERDETFALMLDRAQTAEAKLAKAMEALEECVEEIDAYIQHQYPHDHPVQERHRQQDYASNPARLALAELTGGKDE